MPSDPIPALKAFGYTERESAFLYLVAAHSGYFLRRQFDYFIDRTKGSIVLRFLRKARVAGHIESLDYPQGWHVYHVVSRTIYRLLGDPGSPLRRSKGDAQVRALLMVLDFVLENQDDHYLASEEERIHFFGSVRGAAPEKYMGDNGRLDPLLAAFPISIVDQARPEYSRVSFTFVDEGLASTGKFCRFLFAAEPLLRAVGNFELIYIATTDARFREAKAAFWKCFAGDSVADSMLFSDGLRPVSSQSRSRLHAQFSTLLLGGSYPNLQRSEVRGSARVRS